MPRLAKLTIRIEPIGNTDVQDQAKLSISFKNREIGAGCTDDIPCLWCREPVVLILFFFEKILLVIVANWGHSWPP